MSLFLIILAAGNSKRLKLSTPKPYIKINNKTLIEHAVKAFSSFPNIKRTVIVYNKKHKKYLNKINFKNTLKVAGGESRQESIFYALKKIRKMNCTKVLIHDSARPNTNKKIINNIMIQLKNNNAVTPIIKVADATKRVKKKIIFKNIERSTLRFTQTPQGFNYKKIYEKHLKNLKNTFDDDVALFTNNNEKVITVPGSKENLKITDKEDLEMFRAMKKEAIYYGIGFDVHRLVPNRKLYLGGLKIKSKLGTLGFSDGDPVLHSITDSILGACKMGDIGKLFSNTNKKYKNIRSTILLKKVIKLIKYKNYSINNIDINVIAEKPKIKKYSKKILKSICNLCEINSNQINIKGKTTEKLGVIGKEKAIACEVITSVTKHD